GSSGPLRQDAMSKIASKSRPHIGLRPWRRGAVLFAALVLGGCAKTERLTAPAVTTAPYDTTKGEVLWAVVPLRNESGTSVVNIGNMSDKLVSAAEEVRG